MKGYDQLMNLVLDDVKETMRGEYLILPIVLVWGVSYSYDR